MNLLSIDELRELKDKAIVLDVRDPNEVQSGIKVEGLLPSYPSNHHADCSFFISNV